jgi:twitching motility protein PilT
MQTMNMSVRELVQRGIITKQTADEFIPNWDAHQ